MLRQAIDHVRAAGWRTGRPTVTALMMLSRAGADASMYSARLAATCGDQRHGFATTFGLALDIARPADAADHEHRRQAPRQRSGEAEPVATAGEARRSQSSPLALDPSGGERCGLSENIVERLVRPNLVLVRMSRAGFVQQRFQRLSRAADAALDRADRDWQTCAASS